MRSAIIGLFLFVGVVTADTDGQDTAARFKVALLSGVGALYVVAALSGKRAAFAACISYPFIASLLRKQYLLANQPVPGLIITAIQKKFD